MSFIQRGRPLDPDPSEWMRRTVRAVATGAVDSSPRKCNYVYSLADVEVVGVGVEDIGKGIEDVDDDLVSLYS